MDPQFNLIRLHARWNGLVSRSQQPDDGSEAFYRSAAFGHHAPPRIARWIASVSALEHFIAVHGRWPRESGPSADRNEIRLAQWVRNQRRRAGALSAYQRERLEALPGFSAAPRDDAWDRHLHALRSFVIDTGRLPAVRSDSQFEHRLAIWVRRQRALYRTGRLAQHRRDDLASVPLWSW